MRQQGAASLIPPEHNLDQMDGAQVLQVVFASAHACQHCLTGSQCLTEHLLEKHRAAEAKAC
jgi:hypothetical protein